MSPARVLEHFERISEAPDAIPRLRRFILDLAVRGKLVDQDPKDEPASALLTQMRSVAGGLSQRGGSHSPERAADDCDEAPCAVPSHWVWLRLQDLRPEFQNGESSRGRPAGAQTVVLRLADIKNGHISTADTRSLRLPREAAEKYRLSRGDILVIRVNGSTELVGRFIVCEDDTGPAYCDHFIRLRVPPHWAAAPFLGLVGNSPLVRDQVGRLFVTTAGQKTINQGHLGSLVIPLPPLAEQHRIVAKVDELMALCDRLEAAQTERETRRDRLVAAVHARLTEETAEGRGGPCGRPLGLGGDKPRPYPAVPFFVNHLPRLTTRPEHIQQLRQTILNLAVRGKLVDHDPNDEPASSLLKHIQAERDRCAGQAQPARQEALSQVGTDEAWFDIPSGWRWARLGTITQVVMGQSPPGDTYNKEGDGIPLINGPVEFTGGPFGRTVVNQYTTAPTNLCEEGDLLLCVRGSTTGRTNIAGFRACIGRGVAAIRPFFADHYVRLFVWWLRPSIIAMGRGIAFPSVSRQQIAELAVPLPPLAEQHRIVAKVDELMALCDRLEAQLTTTQTESRRLLEAVLHQALAAKPQRTPQRQPQRT